MLLTSKTQKWQVIVVNWQIVKFAMVRKTKQTPKSGQSASLWAIPTASHHGQVLKHWGQKQISVSWVRWKSSGVWGSEADTSMFMSPVSSWHQLQAQQRRWQAQHLEPPRKMLWDHTIHPAPFRHHQLCCINQQFHFAKLMLKAGQKWASFKPKQVPWGAIHHFYSF